MKTIIVTGADDGLGKAIVKLLSETENVIAISKTKEKALNLSKEITNIECYTCDVTKMDEVEKTIN